MSTSRDSWTNSSLILTDSLYKNGPKAKKHSQVLKLEYSSRYIEIALHKYNSKKLK